MVSIVEEQLPAIVELCRRYRVAKLEVFGSAAEDAAFSERSDIDFLVEFQRGQDMGPWLAHYFDLKREIEKLLKRNVDLVMEGALKNPWFIREVNRTRRVLYAA